MPSCPLSEADLARLGSQALEEAHSGIAIVTDDFRFAWVNREFCRLTGHERDDILGQPLATLRSELHDEAYYDEMLEALAERGRWQGEVWRRRKTGEAFPALLMLSTVHDEVSGSDYFVDVFIDIDRISQGRDRLEFVVNHDALTRLPNRRLFWDRLELVIQRARRRGREPLSLIFIDLDNFKQVNDSWGHRVGDQLLIEVAEALQRCVRSADTIARVGGDEFVVMLEGPDAPAAAAEAVARIAAELDDVFAGLPEHVAVGASLGVASYPDDADDAEALYTAADQRMYANKHAQREAADGRPDPGETG